MITLGTVVLLDFPQADSPHTTKLRPVLVLKALGGKYDDWLVCMISSQTRHYIQHFDEIIHETSPDFETSGLKKASVIRTGRLFTVHQKSCKAILGTVSQKRTKIICNNLAQWLRT